MRARQNGTPQCLAVMPSSPQLSSTPRSSHSRVMKARPILRGRRSTQCRNASMSSNFRNAVAPVRK